MNLVSIRVGDLVRVVSPRKFIRCGYPLSKADAKKELTATLLPDLENFLSDRELGLSKKEEHSVLDILAHALLRSREYGGTQRSLHTVEEPSLAGEIFRVETKKRCVTGTYFKGSPGRFDYFGEYDDGIPTLLEDQQHHTILETVPHNSARFIDSTTKLVQTDVVRVLSERDISRILQHCTRAPVSEKTIHLEYPRNQISFSVRIEDSDKMREFLTQIDARFIKDSSQFVITNLEDFTLKLTAKNSNSKPKTKRRL